MTVPRANWKGTLRISELACPVSLFTAASTTERIAFHILNRKTGNRVHRRFVDSETGEPVDADDQIKGYETDRGDTVMLEPEEIAAAVPDSDKTLLIDAFVSCSNIDAVYLDKPYYLAPANSAVVDTFVLLRNGMRAKSVAAFARTVLFRRVRSVLIRPYEDGLICHTLNFDYEVRSADEAFSDIPKRKIDREMLDLAQHIIKTKTGAFDPTAFDDRYEAAVAELVHAKIEGRAIKPMPTPTETKVVSLLDALRRSAGDAKKPKGKAAVKRPTKPRRKAS